MDAHTEYARWDDHLRVLRGDTDIEHVAVPEIEEDESPSRAVIDAYVSGIRSADAQIARLIDAASDDTTILVTGDHGEEFGRYGDFHTASLYSSMTQVPFIIRASNVAATGRQSKQVQHIDIAKMLAKLEAVSPEDHWVGESVFDTDEMRTIWHHVNDQVGARQETWKYIEGDKGSPVGLFETPYGAHDTDSLLDENPEKADELREMVEEYWAYCEANLLGDGVATDISEAEISDDIEENLRDLGYFD